MDKLICFNSEKQKKNNFSLFDFLLKWEYCKDGQAGQGRELWM